MADEMVDEDISEQHQANIGGIISCLDLLNEEAETQPSAQQPGDSLNLSRAEFIEELIRGLIPRGGSWSH
jgi:hypothetical protein